MNWAIVVYSVFLFFILTPNILITLPSKGSNRFIVAFVHSIIFAVIWHFTHKIVWSWSVNEGFSQKKNVKRPANKAAAT